MNKYGVLKIVGTAVLMAPLSLLAQQRVDEFDEAPAQGRTSAVADERSNEELTSGYTIKEQELEERRARLLAQETKLLEELHREGAPRRVAPQPIPERIIDNESEVSAPRGAEEEELVPFSTNESDQGEPIPVRSVTKAAPPVKTAPPSRSPRVISSLEDVQAAKVKEERKNSANFESQMQSLKLRSQQLSRELQEAKDRLMIAETEVERLSRLLREKNSATLDKYAAAPTVTARHAPPRAEVVNPPPQVNVVKSAPRSVEDEPLIATVMAEKANLRIGPSKDNSPSMTVSRGTRLVVEKRVGEWYRIITPAGTRAWIASEVVAFGETSQSSPSRTVKIRGYDSSIEDETFKLLNNRSR